MTYITLHYITLHYITLHYITLHYINSVFIFVLYVQEGNHTPSTKPILPERVTLASGNEIPNPLGVTGNELHDGAERSPVDRDGARSTKSKHSTSSIRGLRVSPGRFVGL